jgi:hypothetical protein
VDTYRRIFKVPNYPLFLSWALGVDDSAWRRGLKGPNCLINPFLNLDDYEALSFGSKFVKDIIPAVVHIVYRKLLQYDVTARVFTTRTSKVESPVENNLDVDSPELQRRKLFLKSYITKICSDQSKMAFWEYLDQVGYAYITVPPYLDLFFQYANRVTFDSMMHVGLGRKTPLEVEYIHINATLCLMQGVLSEAILTHNGLPMSKRISMVKALSKVIWIQNDLFAKWYVRDGDEFADVPGSIASVRAAHGRGEIHGQSASSTGSCPFGDLSTGTA